MSRIILKSKSELEELELVSLKEAEEILKEKGGIYNVNFLDKKSFANSRYLLRPKDFEKMEITHYSIHFKNGEVTGDIKYDKTSYFEKLCELANCELWIQEGEGLFAFVHELNIEYDKLEIERINEAITSINTYVSKKKVSENSVKYIITYDGDVYECKLSILNDNHFFIAFSEFNAMNAVQKIITALQIKYNDALTYEFESYVRNSRFGVLITKN